MLLEIELYGFKEKNNIPKSQALLIDQCMNWQLARAERSVLAAHNSAIAKMMDTMMVWRKLSKYV